MRLRAVFLTSWFASVLFAVNPNVQAAELRVPSNDFPSIGAAVARASGGDVITVGAGVYAEHIQIGDPESSTSGRIVLHTNEKAVIKGSIVVTNATVDISGFKIRASKSTKPDIRSKPGVFLDRANGSRVKDCLIRGFRVCGISVDHSADVALDGNLVIDCSTGIVCRQAANLRVNFNTIAGNDLGMENVLEGGGELRSFSSAPSDLVVDASSNWWGDSSGPYHPEANPTGTGDMVIGPDVNLEPWDVGLEPPVITITRAYVSDTSYGNKVYKGDSVEYTIEYSLTGGGEYAKYLVRSKVFSEFGVRCEDPKKTVLDWDFVGQGDHVAIVRKRVPACADDKTHITAYGADYWMEGSWVDVTYRVTLKDPFGQQVSSDKLWEAAIFMVKKQY